MYLYVYLECENSFRDTLLIHFFLGLRNTEGNTGKNDAKKPLFWDCRDWWDNRTVEWE